MASVQLGTKALGSVVKIKINNVDREFIVVQHGRPAPSYDASFDGGTIVLANYLDYSQIWNGYTTDISYTNSSVHNYLANTYINLIDPVIKNNIKLITVKAGNINPTSMSTTNLNTYAFLPAAKELGFTEPLLTSGDPNDICRSPNDGERWAYFQSSASFQGIEPWWTRTPIYFNNSKNGGIAAMIGSIGANGGIFGVQSSNSEKIRPAFVLPQTLYINDSGYVTENTAPTVPSSITVPSTILGGTSVTISWGVSTDAENNLSGYIVQRSTDGGTTWTQIFQGPATTTTNNVAFGTSSVMYRVLAYDDQGLQSGWRTSSNVTVINNRPPTAPSSITVPTAVTGGQSLTITWGTATDPDGNLSGYILERSVNGGAWAQIYQGANLSFTDNITLGWVTVAYRVRAYDTYNVQSDNATSPTRTVNNNHPPVIASGTSGDLGLKDTGFTWTYTVTDADNDAVTVVERINGVQKRSFTATLGAGNTFDVTGMTFMTLLNGPQTMQVVATDAAGASVTHTVTFTKGVYTLSIQLATPLTSIDPIHKMVMNIVRSIPLDASFVVLATNNANDPSPAWEDITSYVESNYGYMFANTTAINGSAFSFKITASRGPGNTGGFISTIGGAFE